MRSKKTLAAFTAGLYFASFVAPNSAFAADVLNMDPSQINSTAIKAEATNLDDLCANLKKAADDQYVHKGKSLKTTCDTYAWTGDTQAQVLCKLRESAKNSPALQYCDARTAATKAKKHLTAAVAIDAAAAATCLVEAFAFPMPLEGVCGWASLAAGAAETVRVVQQLASGMGNAKGGYSVDDEGTPTKESSGAIGLITNAVPIAAGITLAKTYRDCQNKQYGDEQNSHQTLKEEMAHQKSERERLRSEISQAKANQAEFAKAGNAQGIANMAADLNVLKKDMASTCSKRVISLKAGIFFGGLAAFRLMNRTSADTTLKSVEASLRGIVGEGGSAAGAITNNGSGTFSKTAATFASGQGGSSAITAEDLPSDGLEASYLKKTALGATATGLANRAGLGSESAFNAASANGMGGLISALSGGGNGDLLAAADAGKPYFANTDAGASTYASAGGGGSAGGSAAASTPLDFGALLGGSAGGAAAGVSEEAFRTPAAVTSIFHENTHQNIFQIVSGKLENLQSQSRIPVHSER